MLDLHLGEERPRFERQGDGGCFPIVAWRRDGVTTWGVEAVMLSAGTNVEWLRDDLGLIATAAESHDVASRCETSDGVVYVPALLGLGTPRWDYGARGTLLGLTRGSERPQIVRAVLEGVAQRGADLVEAAEQDTGLAIPSLRVDGGMTDNPTFVQALADATQRPVEVSPVRRRPRSAPRSSPGSPSARGAAGTTSPPRGGRASTVEPGEPLDRERWAKARRPRRRVVPGALLHLVLSPSGRLNRQVLGGSPSRSRVGSEVPVMSDALPDGAPRTHRR